MGYKFRNKKGAIYEVNDKPVHRLWTSQDLYNTRLKYKGDEIVSLFGYSAEEILNIISEHEKGKIKMTRREEAIKKVDEAFRNTGVERSIATIQGYIIFAEALGLIKFDEPVKEKPLDEIIFNARLRNDSYPTNQRGFIKDLEANGYKIVKA